jgi:hypothetical protein
MNKNYRLYVKKWRKNNPEHAQMLKTKSNNNYNHRYPERSRFSNKIYRLVKSGQIKKRPCILCGGSKQLEACTASDTPYDPMWLCCQCHKALHRAGFVFISWLKEVKHG